MPSLRDISNASLRELLGTRSFGQAIVNLQNGTATFDSTSFPATDHAYMIDGQAFYVANVTNKALATLDALQTPITGQAGYYAQPKSTTVYYLWVVNAAGTSYVIQGKYSGQVITDVSGKSHTVGAIEAANIPGIAVLGTYAPLAAFKVVNGTTAVFTPATTNWDATNVVSSACPINILPNADVSTLTWTAGGA